MNKAILITVCILSTAAVVLWWCMSDESVEVEELYDDEPLHVEGIVPKPEDVYAEILKQSVELEYSLGVEKELQANQGHSDKSHTEEAEKEVAP